MGLLINLAAATARLWLTYALQWLSRYTARHRASKRAAIELRPSRSVQSSGIRLGVLLGAVFDAAGQRFRTREDGMHLPDCDQAKAFFAKFQQAIDGDKKQDVVAMVRYPLRSYRNGKATVFKTNAQLLTGYETVFTPGVRCAIKAATVSDVWGNWRGFTISAGAIWWDRIIPNSATNLQPSDLGKYPFGVFGVNHSPETDKQCPANQDIPAQQ